MADRPSLPTSPQRTCVGCRTRAPQSELVRVVVVTIDGVEHAVVDRDRRLPGRGAYLHPVSACLDLADRRRALPRALRVQAPLEAAALRGQITSGSSQHRTTRVTTDTTVTTEAGRDGDEHAMSAQQ